MLQTLLSAAVVFGALGLNMQNNGPRMGIKNQGMSYVINQPSIYEVILLRLMQ